MPNKSIKKTQKQKQKQKQTVVVNIHNEKPTRRRKPRTTLQRKPLGTNNTQQSTANIIPQQPSSSTSFNPKITYAQPAESVETTVKNDEVRDLLFKLGKQQQTTNAIMTRAIATRTSNPQGEVILDAQDEARLPYRPPSSLTENDAELSRLRSISSKKSPFSFSTAEEQSDDVHRIVNKLVAPQTPLTEILNQVAEHQTPQMNQPPPEIHVEASTSGTDPIGEVDMDTVEPLSMPSSGNKELAKDLEEFFKYTKALGIPNELLRQEQKAPSILEQPGTPVAEARFISPIKAQAVEAVEQAGAKKVNTRADGRMQQADFTNAIEARDAVKLWNKHHKQTDQEINLYKEGSTSAYLKLGDLEKELEHKHLTFTDMKAFQTKQSTTVPTVGELKVSKVKEVKVVKPRAKKSGGVV